MPDSPDRRRHDDEAAMEVIAALKTAAPTSRHAAMIVDSVISMMGDDAVVETADDGHLTTVFRRDVHDGNWIVPWPIIRFMRGRRLGHIMGAEGPPSDEAPPAQEGPALRLGGLFPGELEISGEHFTISATYGQDGRLAETSRGGNPDEFLDFARAVAKGLRHPAEILIDRVVALDPGRTGPGRLLRPLPSAASANGTWIHGLFAMRNALLDGRVSGGARFIAADGYARAVICSGEERDAVIDLCRREIERVQPRPPVPHMPTIPPEVLAEFGDGSGPFLLQAPVMDAPRVEPSPENTPILLVELEPIPGAPPPFGEWLRLIDDRGNASVAVLRRDGDRGIVIVDPLWADRFRGTDLDAVLDAADRLAAERFAAFATPHWPSSLPPLNSFAASYRFAKSERGEIFAEQSATWRTHGFTDTALYPGGIAGGAMRQRWIRDGEHA